MYEELKKLYNRNDIPDFLQKKYPNGIGIELGVATGQYLTELAEIVTFPCSSWFVFK
jgi:hypothetical protein